MCSSSLCCVKLPLVFSVLLLCSRHPQPSAARQPARCHHRWDFPPVHVAFFLLCSRIKETWLLVLAGVTLLECHHVIDSFLFLCLPSQKNGPKAALKDQRRQGHSQHRFHSFSRPIKESNLVTGGPMAMMMWSQWC